MSGRYASYWNAFLFHTVFERQFPRNQPILTTYFLPSLMSSRNCMLQGSPLFQSDKILRVFPGFLQVSYCKFQGIFSLFLK